MTQNSECICARGFAMNLSCPIHGAPSTPPAPSAALRIKSIVWDEGKYSCYSGYIGKAKVATVNYDVSGSKEDKKWIRTVSAFGGTMMRRYASREEAMKSAAPAIRKLLDRIVDIT